MFIRRLTLLRLVGCLAIAVPAAAHAQDAPTAKPPAQTPPAQTPPATPPAETPAAPAAPAAASAEALPSLFEPSPRQFQFGGRFTSIDGDPARFQRYGDFRDGVLFTDARYAHDDPAGRWLLRATADNVGWRDQRYTAEYERLGRLVISGIWDQIPQFYSVDTMTPYTRPGSPMQLDDATQRAIQNAQATLSVYVPLAPQFDLRERRDNGRVSLRASPTPTLDVTAGFGTSRHRGELPFGASFGFSNDVEVPLPYDSRTNDFTAGAEWANSRQMLRIAYDGSWFDNLDDTLVWDSPLRLDDSATLPGRGRMALWPSNSAQTISAAGYTKFSKRTQLTGFVSLGSWSNDQPLQPFTINAALPQLALPQTSADASAQVFSTNLNFVSRPEDDWRFSARVRHYGYKNETGHVPIPQFINYDTSIKDSTTGGPEPYAHDRTTLDADVTWSALPLVALNAGYTHNSSGHEFRVFEDTGEHVLRLSADAVGSQSVTFRTEYEFADRTGSGLNEDLLVQIGEQPAMRHYDQANRTRHRFTGQVDFIPSDVWALSASAGVVNDDFPDSYFGLQESVSRQLTLSADVHLPSGYGGGTTYSYERYGGVQRSRNANPGQENDPNRDWMVDSKEDVNYFSIYFAPPRFGKTEARVSYDYSFAEGSYFYTIVPGGPLTPPNQLPNVFNKLQQLHLDVRHRLTTQLGITFSYLYEPFRVYDFAFDPSVVNGIVQPSSLVMGYVYRPYTAHSANIGLKYLW